jgi:hypothetical protein
MTTTKSYYVYARHTRKARSYSRAWFDTFDEAHEVAKAWSEQGSALVHITKRTDFDKDNSGSTTCELLIWVAASAELDWR